MTPPSTARSTSVRSLALLALSGLAAPALAQDAWDCTFGDAPLSYAVESCDPLGFAVCGQVGTEFRCDPEAGGFGGATAWLVSSYQNSPRDLSSWGELSSGDRYCCVYDADPGEIELITLSGTEEKDTLHFSADDGAQNLEDVWGLGLDAEMKADDDDDTLYGSYTRTLRERLYGGDGDDVIHGHDGGDLLNGGDGNDVLYGDKHDDYLSGGEGNDFLSGGDGPDSLSGDDGDDILYGGGGDDDLDGGALGEFTSDYLYGAGGDDWMRAAGAYAVLKGGDGNDDLFSVATESWLNGEGGDDRLSSVSATSVFCSGESDGAEDEVFELHNGTYWLIADPSGEEPVVVDEAYAPLTLFCNPQGGWWPEECELDTSVGCL